jgi:hypothetical protein
MKMVLASFVLAASLFVDAGAQVRDTTSSQSQGPQVAIPFFASPEPSSVITPADLVITDNKMPVQTVVSVSHGTRSR